MRRVPKLSKAYVRAAVIGATGSGAMMGVVGTFGGVVARRLGASSELLTVLSCSVFFGFLGATVIGRLAGRFRWGPLFGALGLLQAGCLALTALCTSAQGFVAVLALSRVIQGTGQSLPAALMKVHVHERARPNVLKWIRITAILVTLPTAALVGPLLDVNDQIYRVVFPIAALLGGLACLEYFRLPARAGESRLIRGRSPKLLEEIGILKADRGFLLFMLVFFIGTLAEKISMPLVPIYFTDILNLRYRDVAMAVGIMGPAMAILGYWLSGRLVKWLSPLGLLTACMFLKGIRPVLWALAPTQPNPIVFLIVGEAIFRFSVSGLELGALLSVMGYANQEKAPAYLGIHYLFMGVRGLIGPLIGLALYKSGLSIRNLYWLVATIVLIGAFSLAVLLIQTGRRTRNRPSFEPR